MITVAIELNDAGLRAAASQGFLGQPSPGYALLDGKELSVGSEAFSRCRLKPRWVHNRFWVELDSSSMPKPFPRSLSRADAAHAHLSQVWSEVARDLGAQTDTSVLLALPGSFSVEQLGLILGVARACEIPVTGMVDAALAAVSTLPAGSRILHLDASLHRLVWTELAHDGELARRRVEVLESGGLISLWDAWAKHIAKLLIRQTRFDPFHHGTAEQILYSRLPTWWGDLSVHGRALVTLESDGKEYSVELNAEDAPQVSGRLIEPAVEVARALVGSGEPATLMISARASTIPGLTEALCRLSIAALETLESGATVLGALEHSESITAPGSELPFIIRLPMERQPLTSNDRPTPQSDQPAPELTKAPPTHVLVDGIAHLITSETLWLGSSITSEERGVVVGGPMPGLSRRHCAVVNRDGTVVVEDHSTYGTYLNGRRVEEIAEAGIGDHLRLGSPGVELLLIAVAQNDV